MAEQFTENGALAEVPAGTPFGVPGHRPNVPVAGGVPPWCECGYRWDRRDPSSLLVGEHIRREAERLGAAIDAPGWLR